MPKIRTIYLEQDEVLQIVDGKSNYENTACTISIDDDCLRATSFLAYTFDLDHEDECYEEST